MKIFTFMYQNSRMCGIFYSLDYRHRLYNNVQSNDLISSPEVLLAVAPRLSPHCTAECTDQGGRDLMRCGRGQGRHLVR